MTLSRLSTQIIPTMITKDDLDSASLYHQDLPQIQAITSPQQFIYSKPCFQKKNPRQPPGRSQCHNQHPHRSQHHIHHPRRSSATASTHVGPAPQLASTSVAPLASILVALRAPIAGQHPHRESDSHRMWWHSRFLSSDPDYVLPTCGAERFEGGSWGEPGWQRPSGRFGISLDPRVQGLG